MNGLLAVLLSTLCFSSINLIFKKLRNKGLQTKTTLSLFSFSVPLLLGLGWYLFRKYNPFISVNYLLIILIWIISVSISIFGKYYLYRFKGLTELTSYRIAFSTLISVMLDIFYFKTPYNLLTIASIFLLLLSGYVLSKNQTKIKNISLKLVLGITFLSSIFQVLDYFVYKQGILLQEQILFHVVFSQTILFFIFFLVGRRSLIASFKNKIVSLKEVFTVALLTFIAVIAETSAIYQLPIALVIAAKVIPIVLYSMYDFKNKEVKVSYSSIFAVILIIVSLTMLGFE